MMQSFWQQVYWGNTILAYVIAAAGLVLAWIVIRIVKKIFVSQVEKFTQKTSNKYDDLLTSLIEKFVIPWLFIFANYSIIQQLNLHPRLDKVLDGAMAFVTMYFAVRLVNFMIQVLISGYMRRRGESEERIRHLSGMLIVVKGFVWVIGLLTLARNFGFDVSTLLASLGVGGIAIALASQAILGDLFSYLVIFFDKPFEIGDAVTLSNDVTGTIEYIGIKTTRIRSVSGEQLVISNTNMTNSTIRNWKRMEQRRVAFKVGVIYSTDYNLLQRIPAMIKEIILEQEKIRFDRAHLQEYGTYSINFEIIYFITEADYNLFMDTHQAVLFRIHEEFAKSGIGFAIPSQTVFIGDNQNEGSAKNKELIFREPAEKLPATR
jgi:small-conductance mechanosensitive channel